MKINEIWKTGNYQETIDTPVQQEILNYFTGESTTLDRKKGLLILGGVGNGKTMTLQSVGSILRLHRQPCSEVSRNVAKNGIVTIERFTAPNDLQKRHDWWFDDLGVENDPVMYMGATYRPMVEVIHDFYNAYQNHGTRIFLTTNLTSKAIIERYGDRAADRIMEMCNQVYFKGKSMRQKI